jgi:hypothetical protein
MKPPHRSNLYGGFAGSALLIVIYLAVANLLTKTVDYRIALYSIIALVGIATVIGGEEGLILAFLGWIATFALGYRTMALTSNLKIHPAEIILAVLFVLIFTARQSRATRVRRMLIPGWLFLLTPFWIWGWFLGLQNKFPKDAMLSEARNFIMLFPIFIVASTMLCDRERWRTVTAVLYGTGTWIAAWGVAEYHFPVIRKLFPGFITIAGAQSYTGDGFARAGFSFWGNPSATYTCALAIPLAIPLWRWFPKPWQRTLLLGAIVLMADGVYIGGFRILWAALAIQFALFAYIKKRYILAGVAMLAMLGAYTLIPDAAQKRLGTFFEVLHGTPAATDSSGQKHLNGLIDGVNQALDEPMGIGWTGAGWVHCDFVQMAADLGIPAGLIYLGAWLLTLLRLMDRAARRGMTAEYRDLVVAVLLAFTTAGALLATQAVSVLPQLAYPVWFSWVMAEIVSRQSSFEGRRKIASSYLRSAAGVELRNHDPQHAGVRQLG